MSEPVIQIHNLTKTYKLYHHPMDRLKEALHPRGREYHRPFHALHGLGFAVRRGEIVGIIGRNGAGKSTLLKILAGVLAPSQGSVTVEGRVSALLELGTGFSAERTGLDNIFINGALMGYSRREMSEKIDEITEFAELGEFIHQPLRTYSSGMKARLGFSVASTIDPDILILDEVLAVGDEMFRRKCYARMEEYFRQGRTILHSTHSLKNIVEFCNRCILLDEGELLLDGPPQLVTVQYMRLLHASGQERRDIREELKSLNLDPVRKEEFARKTPADALDAPVASITAEPTAPAKEGPRQRPQFIPNLKPKTTLVHQTAPVDIHDIHIETLDGERVNSLVMNEDYICRFRAIFSCDAEDVSFVFSIKHLRGTGICAERTPDQDSELLSTRAGEAYEAEWRFTCAMLPHTYFLTVAVMREEDGSRVPLIRITDAIAFMVQRQGEKRPGLVNLTKSARITKSLDREQPAGEN
jgi:lipopolysaccharide transport system ATP-binding protein